MIEAVGCTVYLKNNQKMIINNIYNPKGEISKFIEEIVKTLPIYEKYIMLGDLNAHIFGVIVTSQIMLEILWKFFYKTT